MRYLTAPAIMVDISFTNDDSLKHGACAPELDEVVRVTFPRGRFRTPRPRQGSPEADVSIVRTEFSSKLELRGAPDNPVPGYALEYETYHEPLTKEEVLEKALAIETAQAEMAGREPEALLIEGKVQNLFTEGTLDSCGVTYWGPFRIENCQASAAVNRFVRWVDEREFMRLAGSAMRAVKRGDGDVSYGVKWFDGRGSDERDAVCRQCAMNIASNPSDRQISAIETKAAGKPARVQLPVLNEAKQSLLAQGSVTGSTAGVANYLFSRICMARDTTTDVELSDFIRAHNLPPVLHPECRHELWDDRLRGYLKFLGQYADFKLLRWEHIASRQQIEAEEIPQFSEELRRAREVMESVEVGAIGVFDLEGKRLTAVPYYRGEMHECVGGYGIGVLDHEGFLQLSGGRATIFDIPAQHNPRAILENDGIEGLLAKADELGYKVAPFAVRSITKEGDHYIAETPEGSYRVLKPILYHGEAQTPFEALPHGALAARVSYIKVPSTEAFGSLQDLLERFCSVALRLKVRLVLDGIHEPIE